MQIYTRTGDAGGTGLFAGGRVDKDDARVEAYGALDELNATLGLLAVEPLPSGTADRVRDVQRTLFTLGGALADPEGRYAPPASAWDPEPLERWIDEMDGELEPLSAFVLPGGTRAASIAHLARTVCRRAERRVVTLGRQVGLQEGVVPYVNRLSDLLFTLARFLNARSGVADVEWRGREEP